MIRTSLPFLKAWSQPELASLSEESEMIMSFAVGLERAMPLVLFSLYLITSVQICRYAHWRAAGAPTPFLPRRLEGMRKAFENRARLQAMAQL